MKKNILKVKIALLVLGFLTCFLSVCYADCSEETLIRTLEVCYADCSEETLIRTLDGNKKISKIKFGDFVISNSGETVRVIDLIKVKAKERLLVNVELDNKTVLEALPDHPLGPNKYKFRDLRPGHEIDGHKVISIKLIPYKHKYVYDILPQSRSGTYYANDVLIGSGLKKYD